MDINGNVEEGLRKAKNEMNSTPEATLAGAPSCLFPLIQRPSGVLHRQNSGINAILDTDLTTSTTKDESYVLPNSGTGQIRTSYEKPTVSSRRQSSAHQRPLGLANIIQHRMRQTSQGGGNSSAVMDKAFFDSVRDQVRTLKRSQDEESRSSYFSRGGTATGGPPSSVPSTFPIGDLDKMSSLAVGPRASSKFSIGELNKLSTAALPPCASSKFSMSELEKISTVTVAPRASSKFSVGDLLGKGSPITGTVSPTTSSILSAQELQNSATRNRRPSASQKLCVEDLKKCSNVTVAPSPKILSVQELQKKSSVSASSPTRLRSGVSNPASCPESKSRQVNEIVINRDESGANLNINFTVKLSDFEGNSAAGFGLKDGSQSSYSSTEANAMVGPTSPQWSVSTVPSSRVEFRQPKNTCQKDATPQPVVPPVMESQNQNNAVEEGFEHSKDLEDSGVTSVLSAELLALDEVKKTEVIEKDLLTTSQTNVLYNTIMSIASSSTMVGCQHKVTPTPPVEIVNMSSTQVFNNTSKFLSIDNMNLPFSSTTSKSGAILTDENGNVIEEYAEGSSLSVEESKAYVLQGLLKALELVEKTGDSIGSAASNTLSLIANIVPRDSCEFDEETMNASESDIPIQLMKLLCVPKTTRHNIYGEVCGEVEVLQDLGTGTYDAITTLLKWVCGGKQGREEFMAATRTLCSVMSEVDLNSDVWTGVNAKVGEIAEAVGDIAEDIVEDGVDTAEALGNSLVKLVHDVASATLLQNLEVEISAVENEERRHQKMTSGDLQEYEMDCTALEAFFEEMIVQSNTDEIKIDDEETEMDKPLEGAEQLATVDINNNFLVECSSSQQFMPYLEEGRKEDSSGDKLNLDDISDVYPFGMQVDENNNPYSFVPKLLEVTHSASLMYEPAYCSRHAHIEQASLSSVFKSELPSLSNLDNFFSNRTMNTRAFKSESQQQRQCPISSEDQVTLVPNVASSSAHLLPRAPPSSEDKFNPADSQHEEKLIKDMTVVSKLVQDLYDSMSSPFKSSSNSILKSKKSDSIKLDESTGTVETSGTKELPTAELSPTPTTTTMAAFDTPSTSTPLPLASPPETLSPEPFPALEPTPTVQPTLTLAPQPTTTSALPPPPISTGDTPTTPLRSKPELLPSRIPIPKKVIGIKRSSTFIVSKSTPGNSENETDAEHSFIQNDSAAFTKKAESRSRHSHKKELDTELEASSSATSVYSISGDSVLSRSYSRSFLKPTKSSAAKAKTKRFGSSPKISATTTATSSRISSSTSLNPEGYGLEQKTSVSSIESNTEESSPEQERSQPPQTSYQKIFQQKNSSIAKQLSSKRFRF